MSERAPSRDEALEALDFIVNVLKEHEKDLDKLEEIFITPTYLDMIDGEVIKCLGQL